MRLIFNSFYRHPFHEIEFQLRITLSTTTIIVALSSHYRRHSRRFFSVEKSSPTFFYEEETNIRGEQYRKTRGNQVDIPRPEAVLKFNKAKLRAFQGVNTLADYEAEA